MVDVRWHVSPVISGDIITLNGSGTNRLRLPTKKVVKINTITNDGVALDPANDVALDPESGNVLYRTSGVWSNQIGGIVINMDHGYTETEAVDWRNAVLESASDLAQIAQAGRPDCELSSKQIDDVMYRWYEKLGSGGDVANILDKYRLLYLWV